MSLTMPPSNHSQAEAQQQSSDYREFATTTKRIISIIEIFCGGTVIALQIPCIALQSELHFIGTGLWAGIIFIISGAFGIIEFNKRTRKSAICASGTSGFTVFVALCALTLIIADFVFEFQFMQCDIGRYEPYYICTNKMYKHEHLIEYDILVYILGVMMAVTMVELFASLLHSIFGCLGIFKIRSNPIPNIYKEEPKVVFIPVPESQFKGDGTLSRDMQKKYKNNPHATEYEESAWEKKKPLSSHESSYDSQNGTVQIVTPEDEQRGITNPAMQHAAEDKPRKHHPRHSSSESSSDHKPHKQSHPKSPKMDTMKSHKSDKSRPHHHDHKPRHHHDPERQSQRTTRTNDSTYDRRSVSNTSGRHQKPRHVKPDYTRPPPNHGLGGRGRRTDVYTLKPFEN